MEPGEHIEAARQMVPRALGGCYGWLLWVVAMGGCQIVPRALGGCYGWLLWVDVMGGCQMVPRALSISWCTISVVVLLGAGGVLLLCRCSTGVVPVVYCCWAAFAVSANARGCVHPRTGVSVHAQGWGPLPRALAFAC